MASPEGEGPHSAAYFDAVRDYRWDVDHLALIAGRLELERGRPGRRLRGRSLGADARRGPPAPDDRRGVDQAQEWVSEATRVAEQHGLAERFRYQQAVAEALPFTDATFDLVTCQTLLIQCVIHGRCSQRSSESPNPEAGSRSETDGH